MDEDGLLPCPGSGEENKVHQKMAVTYGSEGENLGGLQQQ